jgi:hypothetical protein
MITKDVTTDTYNGVPVEEGLVNECFFNYLTVRIFTDEVSFYTNGQLQNTLSFNGIADALEDVGASSSDADSAQAAIRDAATAIKNSYGAEYNTYSVDITDIDFNVNIDSIEMIVDYDVWTFGDLIRQTGYFPYKRYSYSKSWEQEFETLDRIVLVGVLIASILRIMQILIGNASPSELPATIKAIEEALSAL